MEELIEALADDTTLYKICSWYSGGELFDLAPLPENLAKPVFAQILDAVNFVHGQGGFGVLCVYFDDKYKIPNVQTKIIRVHICIYQLIHSIRIIDSDCRCCALIAVHAHDEYHQ